MPRDLFRTPPAGSTLTRRAGVVPITVAAHAIVIAAAVLVPVIAVGALPDPRASLAYVTGDTALEAIAVPPPPIARPAHRAPSGAPVEAPSHLPEPGTEPAFDEAGTSGPEVDGGLVGGGDGVAGGFGEIVGELPPPPPVPPRVVHVGGDIRPPIKVRDVAPVYPEIARISRVQGIVIVEAVIDVTGRVSGTRLLRSVPLLDEAALTAVRQWVFTPTRLNGQPTSVVMTVTVQFKLN